MFRKKIMKKEELEKLTTLIHDYGVSGSVEGLISALKDYGDQQSDWGYKDKAVEAYHAINILESVLSDLD